MDIQLFRNGETKKVQFSTSPHIHFTGTNWDITGNKAY